MHELPPELYQQISTFSSSFRARTWKKIQLLLIGAILCPGSRTVSNVLRTLGLAKEPGYDKYHAVLYKAKWSALELSVKLVHLLIEKFACLGEALVFGIDETIERRWGAKIAKRGIYRDSVRSSGTHFVKCSGLRWMSLMLLTSLPWLGSNHYWALPFLTALCPSQRYYEERGSARSAKKLTDWARQMTGWLARYVGPLGRPIYLVGDSSYATYDLMLESQNNNIGLIARMNLNARLFHFPPAPPKSKRGPKPKIGKRMLKMDKRLSDGRIKWTEVCFSDWYGAKHKTMLITSAKAIWDSNKGKRVNVKWVLIKDPQGLLDPVLLACSDLDTSSINIVQYFVRRWRVEVTFEEGRRHLGLETQRQWSDLSIERVTPCLLALKSIVCLLAIPLFEANKLNIQTTAWYNKKHFTFSDVLFAVRQQLWVKMKFPTPSLNLEVGNLKHIIIQLRHILANAIA